MARLGVPCFYPILDAGFLMRAGIPVERFARELRDAGVRFLQYRDKDASDELLLERAALLREIFPASDSCLILNDRVPLVVSTGFDGVHVGQDDVSPVEARALLGPGVMIGVSTHGEPQPSLRKTVPWITLPSDRCLPRPPSWFPIRWLVL